MRMKYLALTVRRAAILVLAMAASALAEVPYPHPLTPPEARRNNYAVARPAKRSPKPAPARATAGKRGKSKIKVPAKRRSHVKSGFR